MKSRTRYTLVILGIIAFLALSPFIVLFVSGTRWDSASGGFIKTGIISVKTDPRGAELYLNGKETDSTPATVRFVVPGEYDIALKKDGYFDWNKRLTVRAQYVTWLNEDISSITMFRSKPSVAELASDVLNFYADNDNLIYLTADSIHYRSFAAFQTVHDLKLARTLANPEIIPSSTGNFYLIHDDGFFGVYDSRLNKISDISALGSPGASFAFYEGNDLYELSRGNLYHVFWDQKKRDLIASNVLSFTVNNQAIYYIVAGTDSAIPNTLVRKQLYGGEQNVLLSGLPGFSRAQLFLSGQNQLFVLGDQTLYIAGETLKPIAEFVQYAKMYPDAHKILFATGNEVSAYDLDSGTDFLITRSTKAITNPLPNFTLAWTMFLNDGRLQIIETDNRDHQNNYTFANISDGAKFFADNDFKNVYLLDGGKLTRLDVR